MNPSKARENAVRGLVNLYTVVIGVALSLAVVTLVDTSKGLASITMPAAFLFAGFTATLFPFYHGALRHLEDAYIENENPHIKQGALVIDFLLLFLHALCFVVVALLIRKPEEFAWVLVGLLSVDMVWGVFTHFGSSSKGNLTTESKWAIINFGFVAIAVGTLVAADVQPGDSVGGFKVSLIIMLACLVRSVIDYAWCRDVYFPE